MTNKELLLKVGCEWFIDNVIKLSQMVEDDKISSTNAKIIFRHYHEIWQYWVRHVEKAVTT